MNDTNDAEKRQSTLAGPELENPPIRKVESYIPLRHTDLVQRLEKSLGCQPEESKTFKELCARLTTIFHVEHLSTLLDIEDLYAPLDPDAEVIEIFELNEDERTKQADRLFDHLTQILYSAHYHRLDRDELRHAIDIGYAWGVKLDVDMDVFDRLEIFARGWRSVTKKRRRWQNLFREESVELPEFHRLMIAFRLKESSRLEKTMRTDVVYLKMFKNIPESDLEILLPGSRVRLSIFDQGKILVPNLSSAAMTVFKIFRVGVFLTIVAAAWVIKWMLAAAVLVGYVTKTAFGYFSTKEKYQFGLTKNLYLKNMDNNSGVIYRLFNEAEEQEMCETVLAYSMLWQHQATEGLTDIELDDLSENYLHETVNFPVEFDVHDALEKLDRLGLANMGRNGKWRAVSLQTAATRLRENWQKVFGWHKDKESDDLFGSGDPKSFDEK